MSLFGAFVAIVEALNGLGVPFTSDPSSTHSTQDLGSKLTKASLAFQLAVIAVRFLLVGLFYRKCIKSNIHSKNIKTPLLVLCLNVFLTLVRCIHRLIGYCGNVRLTLDDIESPKRLTPLRYEWYFYVAEAPTMLLNSVMWNLWHPGRYLPRRHNVHLSPGGSELAADEDADGRPLLAKAAQC